MPAPPSSLFYLHRYLLSQRRLLGKEEGREEGLPTQMAAAGVGEGGAGRRRAGISLSTLECVPGPFKKEGKALFLRHSFAHTHNLHGREKLTE